MLAKNTTFQRAILSLAPLPLYQNNNSATDTFANFTQFRVTMADMNQIMQTFANLDQEDRQTTMRALSGMMRGGTQRHAPKKKVNGFIGYRCEY